MNRPVAPIKKTLYQYIGLEPNVTDDEISKSIELHVKKCQSLIEKGDAKAESLLIIYKDAERVLLDSEKRREYDKSIKIKLQNELNAFSLNIDNSKEEHQENVNRRIKEYKKPVAALFMLVALAFVLYWNNARIKLKTSVQTISTDNRKITPSTNPSRVLQEVGGSTSKPLNVRNLIQIGDLEVKEISNSSDYVVISFKLNAINNNSESRKISVTYKGVDDAGFEIDSIHLNGLLPARGLGTLTSTKQFNKSKANIIKEFVYSDFGFIVDN